MIKNIVIIVLIVVVGVVGFFSFNYGHNKRIETQVALSGVVNATGLDELVNSKVVADMAQEITVVLKGKLVGVSTNRTIVLEAGGDMLTVYLRENAIEPKLNRPVEMGAIEGYKGEQVTVVAIKKMEGEKRLEGTTFFLGNVTVKLNK